MRPVAAAGRPVCVGLVITVYDDAAAGSGRPLMQQAAAATARTVYLQKHLIISILRATEFVAPQMTVVAPCPSVGGLIAYGKPCLLPSGGGTPRRRLRAETEMRPRFNRPVKLSPELNSELMATDGPLNLGPLL